jgi:hypothetical protein
MQQAQYAAQFNPAGRIGTQAPPLGVQAQPLAGGNPNAQQLSPEAQAMIAEMQRRAALSQVQRMTEDRGVFGGQMQGPPMAAAPPMNLPQLWAAAPRR